MATYTYTWSGTADLFTPSEWSSIELKGTAVPTGSHISSASYQMQLRVHLNGASTTKCGLRFENASEYSIISDAMSPVSVAVDPEFEEYWRILTFDIPFYSEYVDFNEAFVNQSYFKITTPLTSYIEGGIGVLLSATITVKTGYGVKTQYYNGTEWQPCSVKYYNGSKWIDCGTRYIGNT